MELPTCTECGGMMIILPTECQGCYTIFLKVNQWKEKKRCPFCKKEIIVGTGELLSQFMDRYSSKSQAIFSPEEKDRE